MTVIKVDVKVVAIKVAVTKVAVIPAQAGIHFALDESAESQWIPACAGMTIDSGSDLDSV